MDNQPAAARLSQAFPVSSFHALCGKTRIVTLLVGTSPAVRHKTRTTLLHGEPFHRHQYLVGKSQSRRIPSCKIHRFCFWSSPECRFPEMPTLTYGNAQSFVFASRIAPTLPDFSNYNQPFGVLLASRGWLPFPTRCRRPLYRLAVKICWSVAAFSLTHHWHWLRRIHVVSRFFGRFAGGRSVSFFATFVGRFALPTSPIHAASVKPSAFAWASNAAHQSVGCVMFLRLLVIQPRPSRSP